MARGTSTKRSELDAEHLTARLRERGVEQLCDEAEVWAIVDPSELRKPHAREMPALMRVRKTGGDKGTVPGYRTLNVLGVGRGGRRGIHYHRLFSATEDAFTSESAEIQVALTTVGAALAGTAVTYLLDSQFDDVAVWSTIWQQRQHLVCRLKHADRLVELPDDAGGWQPGTVAQAQQQARPLATVRTELAGPQARAAVHQTPALHRPPGRLPGPGRLSARRARSAGQPHPRPDGLAGRGPGRPRRLGALAAAARLAGHRRGQRHAGLPDVPHPLGGGGLLQVHQGRPRLGGRAPARPRRHPHPGRARLGRRRLPR
jgi:hypothetical protein